MAIRYLYLRIYLTVVAVMLVFALVAAVMVDRHADSEYERIDASINERTAAVADLLAHSLPPVDAAQDEQDRVLLRWAQRLRVSALLLAPDGSRLAMSPDFDLSSRLALSEAASMAAPTEASVSRKHHSAIVRLDDGRRLIVSRVHIRPRNFGDAEPSPDDPPHPSLFHGRPGDRRGLPPQVAEGEPLQPSRGGPPEQPVPGSIAFFSSQGSRWLDEMPIVLVPMGLLFLALAIGSYPVVRRLTRRLESLQRGVEQFGAGQLGRRVSVEGTDEVAAVAASFNQAADRIETLIRANRSLLANASHELRSPLARLKMAVEMSEAASPDHRRALKQEIDRDVRELDALVEEVLLASRLDAQPALSPGVVDVVGLAVDEATRNGAGFELPPGLARLNVAGEERLLRRALRNLLENARRYGGDEIVLTVSCEPAQAGFPNGLVALRVGDRGPGVPADLRERIFEPFYRLPGHSEREGGVGLGLSLVRQIANLHGGLARCEARPGGGSLFTVAVPTLPAPASV